MRAASGIAMIAEPVVNAALPSPASRSEPSRSLAEQRHDGDDAGDRGLTGHLRQPERVQRAALQHLPCSSALSASSSSPGSASIRRARLPSAIS